MCWRVDIKTDGKKKYKNNNDNNKVCGPASIQGEKSIFKLRRIKRVLRVGKPFTLGDTPPRRVLMKLPMSVDIKKNYERHVYQKTRVVLVRFSLHNNNITAVVVVVLLLLLLLDESE